MQQIEVPLQPALAKFLSVQARAARTTPERYMQNLLREHQRRSETARRAQMGYYLSLVEREAARDGWVSLKDAFAD